MTNEPDDKPLEAIDQNQDIEPHPAIVGPDDGVAYTAVSAVFANSEQTAAVVMTAEVGLVAISQTDTPERWEALVASGVTISPYIAPTITA